MGKETVAKLVHPELSYAVRGVLLDVYNALGPLLKEVHYQDAIAIGLEKRGIRCQLEKSFGVYYEDEQVGLYYVDVWIEEGRLLLEIKVAPAIEPLHEAQAISYLKVTGADLAIVVNFGGPSLDDKRLPNFLDGSRPEFHWDARSPTGQALYPELVNAILCACHRVHFVLGPGFLHQVYRRATMIELRRSGLAYEYVKRLSLEYEGHLLGYQDVRLILVEDKVLLATFALRQTEEALREKLKSYLRRLNRGLGLLANFHGTRLVLTPVRLRES
jgi:GxxExxY protein